MDAVGWIGCLFIGLLEVPLLFTGAENHEETGALTSADFLQTVLEAQNYDNRIYPGSFKQVPTDVTVHLVVDSIDSVDESTMEFTSSFIITQEWYDRRLRFHQVIPKPLIELDSKMINSVWVPDLYFANEKKAVFHDVTVPNIMMHVNKTGFVRYKSRVSLTAACPMDLQKFPLDKQKCSLVIKSFAYTRKTVSFTWRTTNPVLTRTFELPQFRLTSLEASQCSNDTYIDDEANFSCIQVDFLLARQIGYYMIQLYIPSILIVSLSWLSFWLTIEAVPARVSLGILTVLTMTTQKASIGVSLPRVSYVKAIDVWMAICLLFVFIALLEFAMVNVLSRREIKRAMSFSKCGSQNGHIKIESLGSLEERTETLPRFSCGMRDPVGMRRARKLDKLSRVAFPVAYGLFCAIYWLHYTQT